MNAGMKQNEQKGTVAIMLGILIALEGIDGSGKTTQVKLLGEALQTAGEMPVLSKEPTNGYHGQKLRESAQNGRMSLAEEIETFVNDRRDHCRTTIIPALESGKIVILDRYIHSTIAYQGARGADCDNLRQRMEEFPRPDITFLLDADPAVTIGRIKNGRNEKPNEFERLDQLRTARVIFNHLAYTDSRICKIDAHQSIDEVYGIITTVLLGGVLRQHRAKPYDCDCWPGLCSFGETDTCRWLRMRRGLSGSSFNRQLLETV